MDTFRRLAASTTLLTLGLITVGAIVRATESGLGCPDWPKCHGSWIPPLESTALIEYSHRLSAALVGVLVLSLSILAWTRFRSTRGIFWPSFMALVTVIVQGGIGRIVVREELRANLVALHFGVSLTLLGLLTVVTLNTYLPRGGSWSPFARLAFMTMLSVAGLLMLGALVTQSGAALVFPDWPLMDGNAVPDLTETGRIVHFLHRLAAALVGALLVFLAVNVVRDKSGRVVTSAVHGGLVLWLAQVGLGAANVFTRSAPWSVVLHVTLGAMLWVASVALVVAAYRKAPAEVTDVSISPGSVGATARAYFLLTKPRIIELLLITTVPAMIVATDGWPSAGLILATLLGGALTAGSANAINCFFDRDIDERMDRTSSRPLPQKQVQPVAALRFGIILGVLGFTWLIVSVNLPAALLALAAILFYVFVYTIWLKRTTSSNIVIGGAAGAAPVLVGWAAVTGSLSAEAWVMFAIIFYWTPPHFWALALRYSDDYRRAGVPMLPVVQGSVETARRMVIYSAALLACGLILYPVGQMGIFYLVVATISGAVFLAFSFRILASPDAASAMSMFRMSTGYLSVMFAGMAVDRLIGVGRVGALDPLVFSLSVAIFAGSHAALLVAGLRNRRTPRPAAAG